MGVRAYHSKGARTSCGCGSIIGVQLAGADSPLPLRQCGCGVHYQYGEKQGSVGNALDA